MNFIYHTDQHELASDFKELIEPRLESLLKFNAKMQTFEIKVKFLESNRIKKLNHEVILSNTTLGIFVKGAGKGINDLAAFDKAFKVLESQLRKMHSKKIEKKQNVKLES